MKTRPWILLVCLLGMLTTSPALANRLDLYLGRFFNGTSALDDMANQNFHSLMRELGLITAPVFLSPAETLGHNGFEFSAAATVAPINNTAVYWDLPTEGSPNSVLVIPHLHIRKGLPFSLEVGGQVSYIPESELFILGGEVKWALNEGFYMVPDFAVRFAGNHMVGAKDFNLTTMGWDLSVSKSFGLGGMMSLTPYAGYNMLFLHATSSVVLPTTPGGPVDDLANAKVFEDLNWQDNMVHRFFVGLRWKSHIFQFVVEGMFSSAEVNLFSFKLGFDF